MDEKALAAAVCADEKLAEAVDRGAPEDELVALQDAAARAKRRLREATEVGAATAESMPPRWHAVGRRATVKGLVKRPDLNGKHGTVKDWSESSGRYMVTLDGSPTVSINVRPQNLSIITSTSSPPASAANPDQSAPTNHPANVTPATRSRVIPAHTSSTDPTDIPNNTAKSSWTPAEILGTTHDLAAAAEAAASVGYGIANMFTSAGFGASRAAAQQAQRAAPGTAFADALHAMDKGIGVAQAVTEATMSASQSVATGALRGTSKVLKQVGADDGTLWRKAGGAIFGAEATESMQGLYRLVRRFLGPVDCSAGQLMSALYAYSLLQSHHGVSLVPPLSAGRRDAVPEGDKCQLEAAKAYISFAIAVYGANIAWALQLDTGSGSSSSGGGGGGSSGAGDGADGPEQAGSGAGIGAGRHAQTSWDQDVDNVCKMCGVDAEEVLMYESEGRMYCPGYMVVADSKRSQVVVSLRGTTRLQDVLTDLNCDHGPYEPGYGAVPGGEVHTGMQTAATRLDTLLGDVVSGVVEGSGGKWGVVVVGHSLGAGVAALLCSRWRRRWAGWDVRGYGYATPCVLSLGAARDMRDCFVSVVLGNDLVPRLGLGTSMDLRGAVLRIVAQGTSARIISAANTAGDGGGADTILEDTIHALRGGEMVHDKLFPPGRILHIDTGSKAVREIDQTSLAEIVLVSDMVSVHMPQAYLEAVNRSAWGQHVSKQV